MCADEWAWNYDASSGDILMWRVVTTFDRVDRVEAAYGRIMARVDGAELLIIDPHDGRVLARRGGARWAIGPSGIAIAHDKQVIGVAHDGVTPLGSRRMAAQVSTLALAKDGRLAIGTNDEVAHVGDWMHDLFRHAPPKVPIEAHDLWPPCIHGIGFLADGDVIVVGGTGTVDRLDEHGALAARVLCEALAFREDVGIYAVGRGCLIRPDPLLPDGVVRVTRDHALVHVAEGSVDLAFPWLLIRGEALVRLDHDGQEVAQRALDDPSASALACDGDAVVIGRTDGTIAWWQPDSGDVREELDLGVGALRAVAVMGDRLIALDADGELLLAAREGALGRPLVAPARPAGLPRSRVLELGPLWAASWGAGGRTIGVHGDESYRIHDAEDGRCIAQIVDSEPMHLFRADGAWVAYFRNSIHIVDEETLTTIGCARVPADNLRYVGGSTHGLILASVAGLVRVDVRRGAVELIDVGTSRDQGILRASVQHVIATETRLVVSRSDEAAWLLALPSGDRIAVLPERQPIWSASPDGTLFVDARSGTIRSGIDGAKVGQLDDPAPVRHHRRSIVWFPDGHALVRSGDGAAIFLRDGTHARTLSDRHQPSVCISPDGTRIALGDDGYLAIYDRVGVLLAEHRWNGVRRAPRFLSPSRILAVPHEIPSDNPVPWLLDARTGERVGLLRGLRGDMHEGSGVLWRRDLIVLATRLEAQARVYRLNDATLLGVLAGHSAELRSLDVDASGASLLVGDQSGRVSVWRSDGD